MGIRRAIATSLFLLAAPASATAAPLAVPATAVGVISSTAERPSCEARYAPWTVEQLRDTPVEGLTDTDELLPASASEEERGVVDELAATAVSGELQAAVTICSPTFAGAPGAPTGTTAAELDRSRIGTGWRELGASLFSDASLRPGDRLRIPAVDAAAQLRVYVASHEGGATTALRFNDLSTASSLTVDADQRGLIVRLARDGGATTEIVSTDRRAPEASVTISGSFRSWEVTSQHLPGTAVIAGLTSEEDGAFVRASTTGTARYTLQHRGAARIKRAELLLVTSNYDAHLVQFVQCDIAVRPGRAPRIERCQTFAGSNLLTGLFSLVANGLAEPDVRQAVATRLLARAGAAPTPGPAVDGAANGPVASGPQGPVVATRAAATAPIATPHFTPIARSGAMVRLKPYGANPLQHDINGDRQPDFWSDLGVWGVPRQQRRDLAGYVFLSSPRGLVPRRVVLPGAGTGALDMSELSSIADITGDGIGELVVDLNERHAIIPGHRGLATRRGKIDAGDPAGKTRLVLAPSLSSPGAPYAALDDVTGDGRRELAVIDDTGAAATIGSDRLHGTGVLTVPAALRLKPTPEDLLLRHLRRTGAPKGDPAVRVIGGQLVATTWEPATAIALGKATFTVRDATGAPLRPPVTLATTGDASLLDYDRRSGDLLVWVAPAGCTDSSCRHTILRVAPDGAIEQQVTTGRSDDEVNLPSARFVEDGPDGDDEVEVAFSWSWSTLAFAPSGSRGTLTAAQLGRVNAASTRIGDRRYAPRGAARPIPIVAADGSRVTVIAGSRLQLSRGYWTSRYPDVGSSPLRLQW